MKIYRGARRNECREKTKENPIGIRLWVQGEPWMQANAAAKLLLRSEQCRQARAVVSKVIAANQLAFGVRLQTLITDALLKFWTEQKPRSRVNSRIIRELAHV